MEVSTTGIQLSRVKELPWRISMRQGFRKLTVRWLLFLVFSMVQPKLYFLFLVRYFLKYLYGEKNLQMLVPCSY